MKKQYISALLAIILFSCAPSDDNTLTYTVSLRNFENIISIEGTAEPIEFISLNCPMRIEGTIAFLLEEGTLVEEGDIVCKIEALEIENLYDQLTLSLENTEANLNKTKANLDLQYALLEAQVQNNQADTEIAQLDSLQLLYSPKNQRRIKELELEMAAIEKVRYEKKLQALEIINQSEIRKLEIEIQQIRNRRKMIKDLIDELILKAPRRGVIIRSNNPQTGIKFIVGDLVWSNTSIASIPSFDEMKVIIQAPERDFKSINIGDSVSYSFDALPGEKAWGKILKKAPVAQPYKRDSKVKFFEIEASIDSTTVMPEPGFTVNCDIFLRQVNDTLVVPQIAVFDEDSIKVVYVKSGTNYEMRQVIIGISSPKEVIIAAGLKTGELISLSKPDKSAVKKQTLLPEQLTVSSEQLIVNGDTINGELIR